MKVRIQKLHKDAVIPSYAKTGDAGLDLVAISMKYDNKGNVVYKTGLAIEIPEGHLGLLFPRSSITNLQVSLGNSVGVIDSGYRGEIILKFKPTSFFGIETDGQQPFPFKYEVGDKIAQLIIIPYPSIELEETDELSETERSTGGFGHTGQSYISSSSSKLDTTYITDPKTLTNGNR